MIDGINIKKLEFYQKEISHCFFITSIKYTWKFILDNKQRLITLLYTKILGKRIIYLDDKKILDERKYIKDFIISFPIEYYNITILQREKGYVLKINNISFNHILDKLKLQKFNILEKKYKQKQYEIRIKQLQKRKNKILLKTIKDFNSNKDNMYIINLNDDENGMTNENTKEDIDNHLDDSKTLQQSFELSEKTLNILKKEGKNEINKKNNHDDKIKSERVKKKKSKIKLDDKTNSSLNEMIDTDLFGD
jgi:hypothetical protein